MHSLTDVEVQALTLRAEDIRESVIKMLVEAGSGHTAGSLGMADIFTALYFRIINHNPRHPEWVQRDRVILSNGHIAPILYATMAHAGYFSISELKTLRKFGSRLQGHPHKGTLPGIETSSGPLGSGLSQAIGMALMDRLENHRPERYFYCCMGDGEINEGQVWESFLLLNKYKLSKVISIIDRNTIQIDGYTEDVLPLESLKDKLESFNFHVVEIDGHNFKDIVQAVGMAKSTLDRPTVIIAHTIPGKGVTAFEGDYRWHGKAPSIEEGKSALKELRSLRGKVKYGEL
ncbi:transketolase [Candidatus Gracilibacteria bacterium]|nr:transketolase [Candidatus Gracilibacteria bacterium]